MTICPFVRPDLVAYEVGPHHNRGSHSPSEPVEQQFLRAQEFENVKGRACACVRTLHSAIQLPKMDSGHTTRNGPHTLRTCVRYPMKAMVCERSGTRTPSLHSGAQGAIIRTPKDGMNQALVHEMLKCD